MEKLWRCPSKTEVSYFFNLKWKLFGPLNHPISHFSCTVNGTRGERWSLVGEGSTRPCHVEGPWWKILTIAVYLLAKTCFNFKMIVKKLISKDIFVIIYLNLKILKYTKYQSRLRRKRGLNLETCGFLVGTDRNIPRILKENESHENQLIFLGSFHSSSPRSVWQQTKLFDSRQVQSVDSFGSCSSKAS